jgi:hypothetical protein
MTLPKQSAVVDVPEPGPGKVLVKVHASSLNAADHRLMRATPFLARLVCFHRRSGAPSVSTWPVWSSGSARVCSAFPSATRSSPTPTRGSRCGCQPPTIRETPDRFRG